MDDAPRNLVREMLRAARSGGAGELARVCVREIRGFELRESLRRGGAGESLGTKAGGGTTVGDETLRGSIGVVEGSVIVVERLDRGVEVGVEDVAGVSFSFPASRLDRFRRSWLARRVMRRESEDLEESVESVSFSEVSIVSAGEEDVRVLVEVRRGRVMLDLRRDVIVCSKSDKCLRRSLFKTHRTGET